MSKIGSYNLDLEEKSVELGYENKEEMLAHQAWLEKKEQMLARLERINTREDVSDIIKFIQDGEM